jgi:cytoskeleton-associated protein 5
MKMVGERPLNALVDGLADVRKAKVKEAYEKATVKSKAATGPVAAKGPPAKKAAPAKKDVSESEQEPPKKPTAKAPAKVAVGDIPWTHLIDLTLSRPRNLPPQQSRK